MCFCSFRDVRGLSSVCSLVFLSYHSYHTIQFAQGLIEWMSDTAAAQLNGKAGPNLPGRNNTNRKHKKNNKQKRNKTTIDYIRTAASWFDIG